MERAKLTAAASLPRAGCEPPVLRGFLQERLSAGGRCEGEEVRGHKVLYRGCQGKTESKKLIGEQKKIEIQIFFFPTGYTFRVLPEDLCVGDRGDRHRKEAGFGKDRRLE